MQERRIDTRLLCAELVEVIWRDAAGCERHRIGNLEDISKSGLCVQFEISLTVGTRIRMVYGDGELVGTVRYSLYRDGAYFLGIELDHDSKWSTKHFRPQHLVDPRDLVEGVLARRGRESDSAGGQFPPAKPVNLF